MTRFHVQFDDILLLAPTVSSLQQLLHIRETELMWLDMSINVKKSSCLRVGPRSNSLCSKLTTLDGREIMWMSKVRYLGVHLTSSKGLSCDYDLIKKSFYLAFNAIYGKVGRLASADVVIELFKTKCMPVASIHRCSGCSNTPIISANGVHPYLNTPDFS